MPVEINPEDFIAWRAETKNELKWIRKEVGDIAKGQQTTNIKLGKLDKEIGIMKAKVAIYAAVGGGIISIIVIIVEKLLKG